MDALERIGVAVRSSCFSKRAIRLRYPNGVTHFMVICGKRGWDYLVRDPGSGGANGVYPLKDFGGPIKAPRFYRKP